MKPLLLVLVPLLFVQAASNGQTAPFSTPDQAELVKDNNAFAVDLYGQLRRQDGNLFYSPVGISTALAMTYAGARGDTASEMAKTLHFTLPPDRLHPAMGAFLSDLNATHSAYQLRVANALWAQQGYQILDGFLKLNRTDYDTALLLVDFKDAAEKARLTINQWVEQKTEDKVKGLLQPGEVHSDTKLLLTDAIYFKSDWQTKFKKKESADGDFFLSPLRNVTAPMMHQSGGFNYLKGDAFRALEIPYQKSETSLIVFLPDRYDGLSDFERSLNAPSMRQWLSQLRPVPKVTLTLPTFKINQEFEMQETLGAMGMPSAFLPSTADFSGISHSRKLFVSAMIHKTFIEVDEEGTEAAAASEGFGVAGMDGIGGGAEDPPISFTVDHPFIFLIRHNPSGSILFIGRVIDPRKLQ
jgi:serpin B